MTNLITTSSVKTSSTRTPHEKRKPCPSGPDPSHVQLTRARPYTIIHLEDTYESLLEAFELTIQTFGHIDHVVLCFSDMDYSLRPLVQAVKIGMYHFRRDLRGKEVKRWRRMTFLSHSGGLFLRGSAVYLIKLGDDIQSKTVGKYSLLRRIFLKMDSERGDRDVPQSDVSVDDRRCGVSPSGLPRPCC